LGLGIYAIHLLFVDLFRVIGKEVDSPLWEIGYVLLVFALSAISVIWLAKNKITGQIVIKAALKRIVPFCRTTPIGLI
jgi:hypothetical protein